MASLENVTSIEFDPDNEKLTIKHDGNTNGEDFATDANQGTHGQTLQAELKSNNTWTITINSGEVSGDFTELNTILMEGSVNKSDLKFNNLFGATKKPIMRFIGITDIRDGAYAGGGGGAPDWEFYFGQSEISIKTFDSGNDSMLTIRKKHLP